MSKPKPTRHAPQEIDDYLAALPEDRRVALGRVRAIIRETAPDCTERVSYKIPIFRSQKDLVGLSSAANHCSLHVMSSALMETLSVELAAYKISGATVQFTPEEPLPREVIVRIVQARMEEGAAG